MLLKTLVYKKKDLTTVTETSTLEEALKILETSGYRCVPILDSSGNMTLPVTHLLKNATKFIYLDTSFFKVFFTIKELPYIAVLDSENHFYGILTHSTLLNMLSQSWSVEQGSYVLTIASTGKQGDLAAIAKIISKHSSIASCITLDIEKDEYIRRTLITLPANTEPKVCETIVNHLEKKNYKVVEIENLQNQEA